ncbi:hypothetical protein H0O02_05230 [Candidatus Micrarchaeota archaeon]|nr:hypothetical protein [Candidatus Micrarchaeota archaeon]
MNVLRISATGQINALEKLLPENALLLDGEKVRSSEELELAELLAKDAFAKRSNMARRFRYEFLLWLAGKTDIKSALASFGASQPADMLLVVFGGEASAVAKKLDADKKQLNLEKTAEPLALERISLGRIKN